MGLRKILGLGLLGIVGCASVDQKVKAADHPLGVECSETECVLPRSKDLVPDFEWVYHSPEIEVREAKRFPGSDKTVVYVADVHLFQYQLRVMKLLSEFKDHGFGGIIGLEGIAGNLSEQPEKTREIYENDLRLWKDAINRAALYPFLTLDKLLQMEVTGSNFLDYCPEEYLICNPGNSYSFPTVELFNGQATVIGIENVHLYVQEAIPVMKNQLQQAITLVSCFYQLHTDDFASCSGFLDQSHSPENKRDPEFLSRYRRIRDQKESLAEMLAGMKKSYACLDQIPVPSRAVEENNIDDLRSRAGVQNLVEEMDKHHINQGLLIFGAGHEQEIRAELSRRRISYLSIQPVGQKKSEFP